MSSQKQKTDAITRQLQKIERLISTGKYPDAANALQAAEQASPGDPRIYLLLSRLAEHNGNPKAALGAMERAVKTLPNWPVSAIELALLLARQNQQTAAVDQAIYALGLAPESLDLLTRAIDIAHDAQQFSLALEWLRRAEKLAPANRQLKQLIAFDLKILGYNADAIAAYTELLASDKGDTTALLGRAQAALASGDLDLAQRDCSALLVLDSSNEEYRFWTELAHGRTPTTQPLTIVRKLHDDMADVYDEHLVRSLRYQLPKQVAELITARYPDHKLNVLDLGCGTGLLGVCLGRIDGALVGVDLSEKMVAKAIRHNVYDRFHTVNLLDALQATPQAQYDVIAACDVFIYVGDLTEAIPNAHRILIPGGHLIFSIEAATQDEANLVLRPTMRYAHQSKHIETLCRDAGFDDVSLESTVLRFEGGEPINGFIVVAHKSK